MALFTKIAGAAAVLVTLCAPASAAVHEVGPGGFPSIRAAIEAAAPGDTVRISAGRYREGTLLIDKPIELVGSGAAVIDGSGAAERSGDAVLVRAAGVRIRNLTFRDTPVSAVSDNAALKLEDSADCEITGNRFEGNFFAIYLARTKSCRISDNAIVGSASRETMAGNGIHLWNVTESVIERNEISGHRDGIYFEFVKDAVVTRNKSSKNLRYGLHFMFSDRCRYTHNTFRKNGAGVAVMYTSGVEIVQNEFIENWGPASYGLLLKEIRDSRLAANYFSRNTTAVFLEGSTRVSVEQNELRENGWGVRIMGNALDNTFRSNDFSGNTFDVSTNASRSTNVFSGNYWANYRGHDLDRDGIGDVPYRPVRLFSVMTERNQALLALLHSAAADLLDLAESIFPALTPETLVDHAPSMRRFR